MMGAQAAPVALSQEKKVCGTCGSEFTKQSNLNRHKETKHADQSTPEAVAKRFKLKEYRKNTRRKRANDPVYREKMQQVDRTYRMNKKACQAAEDGAHTGGVSNDVKAKDESIPVETEAEKKDEVEKKGDGMWIPTDVVRKDESIRVETEAEKKDEVEKKGDGMWIPTDVVRTLHPLPTAPMIVGVVDEDSVDAGERVKKARKKDTTKGVPGRLETTALTTANVISFFTPKYDAPRSKEQRAANPRPSAI